MISRIALCNEFNNVSREDVFKILYSAEDFSHYISSEIVEKATISLRKVVVQIKDSDVCDFKWNVKNYQTVKPGDVIATYKVRKERKTPIYFVSFEQMFREVTVTAPVMGTLFQIKDNNTYYGIISHKDDSKDIIKRMIKGKD